jgi:hypothetical protein
VHHDPPDALGVENRDQAAEDRFGRHHRRVVGGQHGEVALQLLLECEPDVGHT